MTKSQVLIMLAMLAEQSGEKVSEGRVDFVGQSLLQVAPPEQIIIALNKLLRSSRRFPTVGEVEEVMGVAQPTAKDEALQIADCVIQAAIRFGWLQPDYVEGAKARELAVGPAGWEVIKRQGGWNNLLERLGENQMALRAQLRDIAQTYLKTGIIAPGGTPIAPPSPFQALEAVKGDRPLAIEEDYNTYQARRFEAKTKITAEIEALKVKRKIALIQEEWEEARLEAALPPPVDESGETG